MTDGRPPGTPPIIAVVGPGAVGSYFGGMLARAGAEVTLLGRPGSASQHLEAVARRGLRINGVEIDEVIPVGTGQNPEGVDSADLVLFAVKTTATEVAARSIAPLLRPETIVVSLQNGVDNIERMAANGVEALPSVVFVAAEIETPGSVRHRGRGDLNLAPGDRPERALLVSSWFEAAGVPCPVSEDFPRAQWTKLIINSMVNAISALGQASHRSLAEYEPTWRLAITAAGEAAEVARRLGIAVDIDEVIETASSIAGSVGDATSSTEQDLARGRPTEIDSLNGYIARRGAEVGIPTPTHAALAALVGLRERTWTSS